MCGRYGLITGEKEIAKRFNVRRFDGNFQKSYNIAPSQKMPVVLRQSPNSMKMEYWGFAPDWSNKMLINAQAEKLAISKVWRKAYINSRCIVPADYFFEWQSTSEGKKPFLIRLKNQKIMGFAGLILDYVDKNGKDKEGFVIITTQPNSLMKKIHDRMPAILREEDEDEWLNPGNTNVEKLDKLLIPAQSKILTAYIISSSVNSPENNNEKYN